MKKRKDIAGKIADELQVPVSSVTSDTFKIEFSGNRDVTVEGCRGVVEYDETQIALNAGDTLVRFRGSDLEINTFFEDRAVIKGLIAEMEFSS